VYSTSACLPQEEAACPINFSQLHRATCLGLQATSTCVLLLLLLLLLHPDFLTHHCTHHACRPLCCGLGCHSSAIRMAHQALLNPVSICPTEPCLNLPY